MVTVHLTEAEARALIDAADDAQVARMTEGASVPDDSDDPLDTAADKLAAAIGG